ncbi:hypothetical protein [Paraburkholderia sp. BR14320]|uniref:hypothetical protein n=1 Tax=unclassified Paraburkholderia TaxID=2615204 RepID=UPI0034CFDCCD
MFDPAFASLDRRWPPAKARVCLRTRKRNPIEPDAKSQAKSAHAGAVKNRLKFAKLLFAQ